MTDTLPNYTDIRLTTDYARDGLSLPAGALGTIVDVYPQFGGYMVEFHDPLWCVEMLPMNIVAEAVRLPAVEYDDMGDEGQRIVDAGETVAGSFPQGMTREQLAEWLRERFGG